MTSFKRRNTLISIEKQIQENTNNESNINNHSEKYFITFPYPYMNGTLHLGHAYTICRADFIARYKTLKGFNVLFPFAFHGTGMPIVACANKLKIELDKYKNTNINFNNLPKNSQVKILYDMGIQVDELNNFIDPYYWIKYFPIKAKQDVQLLGAKIDFSRSFYTTDANPYYDSFVKWQFDILNKKNLLKFGKRYVIFSEHDNQPCADHDRSVGEGVIPAEYKIMVLNNIEDQDDCYINFIATLVSKDVKINQTNIYINKKDKFIKFKLDDIYYVCNEKSFRNIKNQFENINEHEYYIPQFTNYLESNCIKGTGIYISSSNKFTEPESINNPNNLYRYFEPMDEVISRSGNICVVAKTDQWFINYGDENLKIKINNYLDNHFITIDPEITQQLKKASSWINEWPCSRQYGLGTRLLNTEFLIDSLSDSTIYMAYYTIAHLINKIPIEKIKFDIWNHIFLNQQLMEQNYTQDELNIINQMKKEFTYWYPINIRISGKDLVNNHLIMCLYNHMAIWDDVKLCPKSFAINGHITLNGEKMSKSTGNFKTLNQVVRQYGADATRLTLIEGDGTKDADFRDNNADGNLLKLYSEKEWFESLINILSNECVNPNNDEYNFWDKVFDIEISTAYLRAEKDYENYNFRQAIYNGFHSMLLARDKYRLLYEKKYIKPSFKLLKKFMDYILLILYPICPHLTEYLWVKIEEKNMICHKKWVDINLYDSNLIKYKYYADNIYSIVNKINNNISKFNKKKRIINYIDITYYKFYSNEENNLITRMKNYNIHDDWKNFISDLKNNYAAIDFQNYAKFSNYIKEKMLQYNKNYLDIRNYNEEFEIASNWLPILIDPKYKINIILEENGEKFKYGPDLIKFNVL